MFSELKWLRIGVPVAILLAAFGLIIFGGEFAIEAGVTLIGVAITVSALNIFLVMSHQEEDERDAEAKARDYYREHGKWPQDPN